MGGWGSGRSGGWGKATVESIQRIDIRWLKKQGYLHPGKIGALSWSCGGEPTGSIGFRIEADSIILFSSRKQDGEKGENVQQTIHLARTTCHFGGYRKWLVCPHCGRRVALLHLGPNLFLCRHCYNLSYASQQEQPTDRLMRKTSKILNRLGVEDIESILFKPKGMHQTTFDRLRREAEEANLRAWVIMGQRFGLC